MPTSINPSSFYLAYYFMNPDQVAIYYSAGEGITLNSLDLKFSYSSTCSVWSRPTTTTLISKIGLDGFTVGATVYQITQNPFLVDHCQGLTFTYSAKMQTGVALLSWITFDSPSETYFFSPTTNTRVATYALNLIATIDIQPTYQQLAAFSTASFNVEVIINLPPYMDTASFNPTISIYAHHNWNITAHQLLDIEGDTAIMQAYMVASVSNVY